MQDKLQALLNTTNHRGLDAKNIKIDQCQSQQIDLSISVDAPIFDELITEIQDYLNALIKSQFPNIELGLNIKSRIIAHKVKAAIGLHPQIKNVIAISSGKGGVGKSTVCVNLATAFAQMGAKVGILDCDLYGPSIPRLFNAVEFKPDVAENKFVPLEYHNMQIMSFGFLVDEEKPTIWRGSIVNKAIDQMFNDSAWDNLDYLFIDLPPGTGDIQLTMAQKLPITGVVTITTPQDLALVDVKKSILMFDKLEIPHLGIIENMSYHQCQNCGTQEHLFGEVNLNNLAQHYNTSLLAQLPLALSFSQQANRGEPLVLVNPEYQTIFRNASMNLLENLAKLPKAYSAKLNAIKMVKK